MVSKRVSEHNVHKNEKDATTTRETHAHARNECMPYAHKPYAAPTPLTVTAHHIGYAVSYGYGGAVAACALLTLANPLTGLARWHALALVFYGVRLNSFLLWRELRYGWEGYSCV